MNFNRLTGPSLALAVAVSASAALSQTNVAQVETDRDAVFAQLLSAPTDRALMLRYARLSVQMRDYEAAVSTLERLLDLDPGDTRARYELGIAYYALGSYELARYHFGLAEQGSGLNAEEREALAAYTEGATENLDLSRWSGVVSAGIVQATEGDLTGQVAQLALRWSQDMNGPDIEYWLTDLIARDLRFSDDPAQDQTHLRLRTGPWLSLQSDAYGVYLRPYLEFAAERDGSGDGVGDDVDAVAIGVQYRNTINAHWGTYADFGIGRAEEVDTGIGIDYWRVAIGASWRPARQTFVRGTVRAREDTADDGDSVASQGLRIEAVHEFPANWSPSPRDWRVAGFVQMDMADYAGAAPREDTVTSAGARLRGYVYEDIFVEGNVTWLERDSDNDSFDDEETLIGIMVGMEF